MITADTATLAEAERVVSPDHINHEAANEPLECRQPGPLGLLATRAWLRSAFERFEIEVLDAVENGPLVALRCEVTVRHTGDFVFCDAAGDVKDAFPATLREATMSQTHWFTIVDGLATLAPRRPRRSGHGRPARLGAAQAAVPARDGARQAPRPPRDGARHGALANLKRDSPSLDSAGSL